MRVEFSHCDVESTKRNTVINSVPATQAVVAKDGDRHETIFSEPALIMPCSEQQLFYHQFYFGLHHMFSTQTLREVHRSACKFGLVQLFTIDNAQSSLAWFSETR